MKEVKAAEEQQQEILQQIEEQMAYYEDALIFAMGGEESLEKKTVKLQRDVLYSEIWKDSLSKVAKKYEVPYQKLKEACEKADIPLPTQSYWGNLSAGKAVEKEPLPESKTQEVVVEFSVKSKESTTITEMLKQTSSKLNQTIPAPNIPDPGIIVPVPASTDSSPKCKSADGSNLYEREVLYQEVWEQPVTKVAIKYGVSDVMIHKVCKTLNVPVPPRGYWAKKQAGQSVEVTPLPGHSGKTTVTGLKTDIDDAKVKIKTDESLSFLGEEERLRVIQTAIEMHVAAGEHRLHPVLLKHKAAYNAWKKSNPSDEYANWSKDHYRRVPDGEPPLWNRVSEKTLPRLYLILDVLYRAIESLGGSINNDLSVQIRGEHVCFEVMESKDQAPHVLTRDEQKQWDRYERDKRTWSYAYEPRFRKYDYIANGKLHFVAYRGRYIRDSNTAGIESRVGDILLGLYMESEVIRIEREAHEAAQRKAEEEQRKKELRRQLWNDEVDRIQALNNEAADFAIACKIRAYVSAVEGQPNLDDTKREWITWAKAKADWYDPTIAYEDQIFGVRKHRENSKEKTHEKLGYSRW